MTSDQVVILIGAVIAIVGAGYDEIRADFQNLTGWGVIALSVALLLVTFVT